MYKKILVPIDGSETSKRGLQEAIRLAQDQSARLQILTVAEEYRLLEGTGIDGGLYTGEMLDLLIAGSKQLVEEAVAEAKRNGVAATGTTIESISSRPAECVIEAARNWPADLIVMGTHGRRGIKRAVLGSDAEMVLRNAEVPVLLVRATGKEATQSLSQTNQNSQAPQAAGVA